MSQFVAVQSVPAEDVRHLIDAEVVLLGHLAHRHLPGLLHAGVELLVDAFDHSLLLLPAVLLHPHLRQNGGLQSLSRRRFGHRRPEFIHVLQSSVDPLLTVFPHAEINRRQSAISLMEF